ncbi:MAG TPA: response regulator transcription factor [Bacillota bacterium]|nr:response regulator transcription factor [Bacillota bacterium]
MAKKILIVEDEPNIAETVAYSLEKEGYKVTVCGDGKVGLEQIFRDDPDLVILDLMLPGMDGMEVCRQVRRKSEVPIIMLTAKEDEIDRVLGLELGADDYITKPFSLRELTARVKTVLRRSGRSESPPTEEETIKIGNLQIDMLGHEVRVDGKKIDLSVKEYEVLKLLATNAGRVLSRDLLLDRIWGADFYGDQRTVDVHIRWLREKIEEDPGNPQYILTVRGTGYKLSREGAE